MFSFHLLIAVITFFNFYLCGSGEERLSQLSLYVMLLHRSFLVMWVVGCTRAMGVGILTISSLICLFLLFCCFYIWVLHQLCNAFLRCFFFDFLLIIKNVFIYLFLYFWCISTFLYYFYFILSGKNWIKSMILTASLFPFMCFGIGFILNTVAIFYGSLAAIPFGTMVVVFVIWAFISFPLALLGTVVGRNWSGAPNNPCRVKTIPRPIPEKKWYLTPSVVSIMGGLLPFGSIFIEMYFVFTSFWNYKVSSTILWVALIDKEDLELFLLSDYCVAFEGMKLLSSLELQEMVK